MDTHCHQVQVPLHILILFVIIIPSLVQASISQSVQKQTQQYFRTRPEAIREINEGQTVIIKCEVGNQAGPVQWVKNGFLLGKIVMSLVFHPSLSPLCSHSQRISSIPPLLCCGSSSSYVLLFLMQSLTIKEGQVSLKSILVSFSLLFIVSLPP